MDCHATDVDKEPEPLRLQPFAYGSPSSSEQADNRQHGENPRAPYKTDDGQHADRVSGQMRIARAEDFDSMSYDVLRMLQGISFKSSGPTTLGRLQTADQDCEQGSQRSNEGAGSGTDPNIAGTDSVKYAIVERETKDERQISERCRGLFEKGTALLRQRTISPEQFDVVEDAYRKIVTECQNHRKFLVRIARVTHNLASILRRRGRTMQAHALQRAAMTGFTNVVGAGHPDTLSSSHNLGMILFELKNFPDAESLLRMVYTSRQNLLGSDHRKVMATSGALALTLEASGRFQEALSAMQPVLEYSKRSLESLHPTTLAEISNAANALANAGRLEESARILMLLLNNYTIKSKLSATSGSP